MYLSKKGGGIFTLQFPSLCPSSLRLISFFYNLDFPSLDATTFGWCVYSGFYCVCVIIILLVFALLIGAWFGSVGGYKGGAS